MGNISSARNQRRERTLYVKPSGLYPPNKWDDRKVARLIIRGELAPRNPGSDVKDATNREECPICMLAYPILNDARCCSARLCTECYLELRAPRRAACAPCPFCKAPRLSASLNDLPSDEMLQGLEDNKRRSEAAAVRDTLTTNSTPTTTETTTTSSSSSSGTMSLDTIESLPTMTPTCSSVLTSVVQDIELDIATASAELADLEIGLDFDVLLNEAIKRSLVDQ